MQQLYRTALLRALLQAGLISSKEYERLVA